MRAWYLSRGVAAEWVVWWRRLRSQGTAMRKGRGYLGEQGAIQYGWIKGCVERWGAEKAEKVIGTSLGKIPDATEGLLVGCE